MNEERKGAIDINDVGVTFNARGELVEAVSSVDMHVKPGEFVSIIGPSGCGKSTLLNIVAGFVKPTSGEALVDGASIRGPGSDRGVVFQQYSLFPWLTVRKNVEFGLKMKGTPASQRETQARTLLGLAGLLAFENHFPDQLSGGMKPRPRTPEMTYTPAFIELVQQLKALIREESLAAMGSELKDGGLSGFGIEVGPRGIEEVV